MDEFEKEAAPAQDAASKLNQALEDAGISAAKLHDQLAIIRDTAEARMLKIEQAREERSKKTWFAHKDKPRKQKEEEPEEREVINLNRPTSMQWMAANFHILQKTFIKHHPINVYKQHELIEDYRLNVRFVRLSAAGEIWDSIEKRFRAQYIVLSRNLK